MNLMTIRDKNDIQNLYFFHRFSPASIARLFGLSHVRILQILHTRLEDVTIISDTECLLCGLEDVQTLYIDGDTENKHPQNIIMLCPADKRRIQRLQARRRLSIAKPQF